MSNAEFENERKELAERVRRIRIESGLTQEKLAEILNMSLTGYKKIESGENQISLNSIRILNRELNICSDYILTGKEDVLYDHKLVSALELFEKGQTDMLDAVLRDIYKLSTGK